MKSMPHYKYIVISSWVTLTLGHMAAGDVPRLLNYQGRLRDNTGGLVGGNFEMRFRIYGHASDPEPALFDETHSSVQVEAGLFRVLIGSIEPGGVPDSALDIDEAYLGVSIGGGNELSPRVRLTTSPYAVKSRSAENLVRPGTLNPAVQVDGSGNVGIGGGVPDASAALDVESTSGGLLLPRMSQAERDTISNPAVGLLIFNTDTSCFNMWEGNAWKTACFDCDLMVTTQDNVLVCMGETLSLTASSDPGATYEWTGPSGFNSAGQNPIVSNMDPGKAGLYTVRATLDGCTSEPASTMVLVNIGGYHISNIDIDSDSPICPGSDLHLFAGEFPGGYYFWNGPNGYHSEEQNPVVSGVTASEAGDYCLEVYVCNNQNDGFYGCVTVEVGNVSADFGFTPAFSPTGQPISFTPEAADKLYLWTFENGNPPTSTDENPTAVWNTIGTYDVTLEVTDPVGNCVNTITREVNICNNCAGFQYSGTIETWTVPSGVTSVTIEASGAQGGDNFGLVGQDLGGKGARMKGDLGVTPGETLNIVVGGRGHNATGGDTANGAGGGGGGSFVWQAASNTLLIAAGGGGGSSLTNDGPPHYYGKDGVITEEATGSRSHDQFGDAPGGNGGADGYGGSAGGKGWISVLANPAGKPDSQYGGTGGYGGGGGSGANCCNNAGHAAGAGGGYSGGGAGGSTYFYGGGGGGSYNAGTNQDNTDGVQTENGFVLINW